MSISAFIPVFNEEKRIEAALISLQWCDEIVMVDKFSTDNTCDIAKRYGAKVFSMPNSSQYDPREFEYLINNTTSEWIIIFTASDVIHPVLTDKILSLINDPDFKYDIIDIPYRNYVLGVSDKRSPWYYESYSYVFRKSVVKLNFDGVHGALDLSKGKHYKVADFGEYYMYHLTHSSVDGMMDRHLRYWRTEGAKSVNNTLKQDFQPVLSSLKKALWKKKTYLLGWDGVMLICAYVSYHLMSFVYRWEIKNSKSIECYQTIRKNIENEWTKYNRG